MTFTSSSPSSGWRGLDFLPGSAGTLDDVTISRAGHAPSNSVAAVRVRDATVSILGGLIEDGRDQASGVRVIGSQGHVTVDGDDNRRDAAVGRPRDGLRHGHALQRHAHQNAASGITATTNATVHVGAPTAGAYGDMVNQITGNVQRGILVASGAAVYHARASAVGQRGYNYIVGNQLGGIASATGSLQNAGSSNAYASYNWIASNQGREGGVPEQRDRHVRPV